MIKFLRKAQLPTQPELRSLSSSTPFLPGCLHLPHLLWSPWNGNAVRREQGGGQVLGRGRKEGLQARRVTIHRKRGTFSLQASQSHLGFLFPNSGSKLAQPHSESDSLCSVFPTTIHPLPWTGLCCRRGLLHLRNRHVGQLCKELWPLSTPLCRWIELYSWNLCTWPQSWLCLLLNLCRRVH